MSHVQDQDGRRVRLPSHSIAVTDVKPSGLTAIRPTAGPVQKTKEGLYQNKKAPGYLTISSVMVKAIKSALMEAAEYNNPVDGKRKTGSSGVKGRPQTKYGIYAKCTTASTHRAPNKKSINVSTSSSNKKKGSGLMSKLELISRMNMEGVKGPRSTSAMELSALKKNPPESPTQMKASHTKKPDMLPARMPRSPTRKVQKDNSKRKSMVSVPVGSPDRKNSGSKKSAHHTDVPSAKNTNLLPSGSLETRNHLSSQSLDSLKVKKPTKQRIEPDITTYEFMRKLMSYSSMGFREARDERRAVKTPTLDAIPEEY